MTPQSTALAGAASGFEIKSYVLALIALGSAMFARVFTALGAPAIVNFLHFAVVVSVCSLVLLEKQSANASRLLPAVFLLLMSIALSAVANGAGAINVLLDFLLLVEPFLLLLAITNIGWSLQSARSFRIGVLLFALVHVAFCFYQEFVLHAIHDDIKGVFLNQNAGHHVGGAVSLSAAVYFFLKFPRSAFWMKIAFAVACTVTLLFSDSKQVIAAFLAAQLVLTALKLKNLGKVLQYTFVAAAAGALVYLAAVTTFPALATWLQPDLVTQGVQQKFSVFSIFASYYRTPLDWLFGLGPGHTVSRLGSLIPDYMQYLQPLGATKSVVRDVVFAANEGNWISNSATGSSLWALTFSWAGIWGDLGLFGLGSYLWLWWLSWRQFCIDDLTRFLAITILVLGMIFSWIEEPGYMLFVASLIGLSWQLRQADEFAPLAVPKKSL